MLEHSNYNLFQGRSCWHVARRAQPTERPDVDHQGRWCNSLTLASVQSAVCPLPHAGPIHPGRTITDWSARFSEGTA